jgi:nucleotide-binding universal stress UspA family protein
MKLKERTMYKNLLIATDGSEIASKAVSQGIDLAKTVGAKVTIVTVSESFAGAVPVEIAIAYPFDVYEKACEENALRSSRKRARLRRLRACCARWST